MTLPSSFVDFGGCNRDDKENNRLEQFSCALEPVDCDSAHSTFVSPDRVINFTHYSCDSVSDFGIGRCSDSNICARNKNSCEDPKTFLSPKIMDRQCSILMDGLSGKATLYSACLSDTYKANKLCVITSEECEVNFQEVSHHDEFCNCSMTRTGACIDDSNSGYFHCSVSSQSCGDGMIFRTAHELFNDGTRDCRLCEAKELAFHELSSDSDLRTSTIIICIFGFVGACAIILRFERWRKHQIISEESITILDHTKSSENEAIKKLVIV